MGENFSGSVNSVPRGSILNVRESIHCLCVASVGNREIFTESGFHSITFFIQRGVRVLAGLPVASEKHFISFICVKNTFAS